MKSQLSMNKWIIVLVLILGTTSAWASYTETETTGTGATSSYGSWMNQVTNTVKTKVESWVNYWTKQPGSQAEPAQTAETAVAPAKSPATAAPVAATPVGDDGSTAAATSATDQGQAQKSESIATKTVGNGVVTEPTKPATALNEENTQLRGQKVFSRDAGGTSLSEMKAVREALHRASVLKVAKPGRAGTSKLARTKQGVPVSNWNKIRVSKSIPRLDIGTETLVSKEDFTMAHVSFSAGHPNDLKRLASPAPAHTLDVNKALKLAATEKVLGPRGLQGNMRTVGKPVTHETVSKVAYETKPTSDVKALAYKPLSDEQLKMVAALILFERGDHCHMIMGLFHQLQSTEKLASTKAEATYYLGACAAKLKMDQVAFDNLSRLVGAEDKEFGADALDLLSKNLPLIYEKDFYNVLKGVKSFKNLVTEKSQDNVAYRMAKGAYRAQDYKTSINYAMRVNSGTEYYDEARFLSAMNSFALKDKPGALKKLEELSHSLEARKVQDKNIRALTAVNLARMYFGLKKYDKALEAYMQVPKDHPLWVNALIEQGWTQLALEDDSGAIGNMYSLHSPYFKAVYQPESFVVRTIGYLQICQYGDAYKTLTWMEKDYRDMFQKTSNYLAHKSEPVAVYNTVKTYIKGKSSDSVENVPYQFWREMAHRKDFLNLQTALNDKQDEAHRYDGVNEKIKSEKASIRWHAEQSKKRFDQWRKQIAKVGKDGALVKNLAEYQANLKRERDLTIAYRFQLAILEQSRQGFLDFQNKSQKRLDKETAGLTLKAGQCLLRHAKHMNKQMSAMLDNNEFLRYEVFSGSGENIRYQVSGGAVGGQPNRIPANIKPQKMMNWNFDGEFWEDEIGSYRSSLQNACPSSMTKQAKIVDDDEN